MARAGTCEGCGRWTTVLSPKGGKMLCVDCRKYGIGNKKPEKKT
jgi:hypothetical protein